MLNYSCVFHGKTNMKILHFLLLLILLLLTQKAEAQLRLVYRSQDLIAEPDSGEHIKSIESRGALSKYITVCYVDNTKTLIPKKEIWGYVGVNKEIWRSYKKEFYRVVNYNSYWVEYVIDRLVQSERSRKEYNTYSMTVYSRTLDSSIYLTWSEAMADIPPTFILR